MKTPTDELFNLIKSLSSDEKRLFKIHCGKNSINSTYVKLFDGIDGLKEYDERILSPFFNKNKGYNKIKGVKSYLQDALLRFLAHHYNDYSPDIQIQEQLQKVEILFSKNLFSLAKKLVVKTEKMAIDNHRYLLLPPVFAWKRRIMVNNLDFDAIESYRTSSYQSEMHYLDLHKNLVEYEMIFVQSMPIVHDKYENMDAGMLKKIVLISKNPFLRDEKKALSIPAKYFFNRILGDINLTKKKWKQAYVHFKKAVDYGKQAKLSNTSILIMLSKLTMPLRKLNKNDEMLLVKESAMELIHSLSKKGQKNSFHFAYSAFMNNYIDYQISILNLTEAQLASDEMQALVEKKSGINSTVIYYFNRLIISLLFTNYREALLYANKVLTKEKTGIRSDVISCTKILSILIHYELGNEELMQSLCGSYARYLIKHPQQSQAQDILLRFFSIVIPIKPREKKIINKLSPETKLFVKLKKELSACKSESVFREFDFISWAESKIQNRPLLDILKEKSL